MSLTKLAEPGCSQRGCWCQGSSLCTHVVPMQRGCVINRVLARCTQVRGRGLMNAVVVREDQAPSAWDICMRLMQNGLLAKPTHGNIIRLAPPLTLTEEQVPRDPEP